MTNFNQSDMRGLDRRSLLIGAASTGILAATARAADLPNAFRNSLSLSPFAEYLLEAGVAFTDGRLTARTSEELQKLFVAHGSTEVYARIATRRGFKRDLGDHSVERGLERGRMAKKLGLPFNPEIGLFAYYGDVSHQPPPDFADYPSLRLPKPWHEMTVEQMVPVLKGYGASIAAEIRSTGATVNYWDLGNEVEFGVAGVAVRSLKTEEAGWKYEAPNAVDPEIGKMDIRMVGMSEDERIAWLSRHLWPAIGKIFAAVAEGIRSVDKSARFSTHISGVNVFSSKFVTAFFKALDEAGYRVDLPGMSFYPSSAAAPDRQFERFKESVANVHTALQRPIFVAEFGYPVAPFKYGVDDWGHSVAPYPISPQGQADFVRDVVAWGASTGHLTGFRPWAPEIVEPGWGAMSFFDLQGNKATARPALDAIAVGLAMARK